jgi:mannosyl-oligosaccharide alpha-1,2-mannosidase
MGDTVGVGIPRRVQRLLILAIGILVGLLLFHGRPSPINFPSGGLDWTSVKQRFPVSIIHKIPPAAKHRRLPRVQYPFTGYVHDATTKRRQEAVRAAFIRCWESYKERAWLYDELAPVSGVGKTTLGGWAATLVDSLDTLWIMGLKDDFRLAASSIMQLEWETAETSINIFETTIRHLGGLLGAYDLSGERALLEKARQLGNMLYLGFDTPNRMPGFWLNFDDAKNGLQMAGTADPSASPCSLSLEFTRLSQLTGDSRFYDAISRVTDFLERTQNKTNLPGLWPKLVDFRHERVDGEGFTLGALADSLYEYLPKMAVLLEGQDARYEKMYRHAAEVIEDHLLFRPMLPTEEGVDILFTGDAYAQPDRIDHVAEGQHLSCFVGGMFALGGKVFDIAEHVDIGERLARGCSWAYAAFPTGLMPEIFNLIACPSPSARSKEPCAWDEDRWQKEGDARLKKGFVNAREPRYELRPEAIESLFILYRITGKQDFRDLAWEMFEAVMKATRTALANSGIEDVTVKGETKKLDSMEVSCLLSQSH